MNCLFYFYYSLYNYFLKNYSKESAVVSSYIALVAVIWVNIIAIDNFIGLVFFKGDNLLNHIFINETTIDRYVITPMILIPIFIVVYLIIRKDQSHKIQKYEQESAEDKRKHHFLVWTYIILSFLIVFLTTIL